MQRDGASCSQTARNAALVAALLEYCQYTNMLVNNGEI